MYIGEKTTYIQRETFGISVGEILFLYLFKDV